MPPEIEKLCFYLHSYLWMSLCFALGVNKHKCEKKNKLFKTISLFKEGIQSFSLFFLLIYQIEFNIYYQVVVGLFLPFDLWKKTGYCLKWEPLMGYWAACQVARG